MAEVRSGSGGAAPSLSQEDISLDETFHMMPAGEGSLGRVLQEHSSSITALRAELNQLAGPGANASDLGRWVERATQLEAQIGARVDKETLLQAGWPLHELEQAKSYLKASADMQRAAQVARQQAEAPQCDASIITDLSALLETWSEIARVAKQAKQNASALVAVNASLDQHREIARPLCETLIAKALQLKKSLAASGQAEAFGGQLAKLYHQDWVKQAVRSLGVQVPGDAIAELSGGPAADSQDPMFTFDKVPTAKHEAGLAPEHMASQTPPAPCRTPSVPASPSASMQPQQQQQQQQMAAQAAPRLPPAELWQAVHVGDLNAVTSLVQRGACNGRIKDASGHSVLWHSIAFSHFSIATMMLDQFPPGSETGVDVEEVHPRRGDTLLHLLLSRSFGAETASLFKRISHAVPAAFLGKANAAGHNFLHVAASTMNFWVLKFVCLTFPGPTKALLGAEPRPPLRYLADAISNLIPPSAPMHAPIPEHLALAELLGRTGRVPFADVAMDVGPLDAQPGDAAKGRFLAHRVVLGAQSQVLLEELEKLPAEHLAKEGINASVFRVDPRISKDVWRSVLQFLYTGVVNCPFTSEPAKMVELLRACAMYKLPRILLDYTQTALFQLLPNAQPTVALQVFSITAGSCSQDVDVRATREAATYILLRSAAQVFQEMDPNEVSKILERIFQTVEEMVFRPAQAAATGSSAAYACQQQQQQQQQPQQQQQQPQQQQQSGMHPSSYSATSNRSMSMEGQAACHPGHSSMMMPQQATGYGSYQWR